MDTTELGKVALRRGLQSMKLSAGFISDLVNGKAVPAIALASKIEAELGVPAGSWLNGDPAAEMWKRIVEKEQTQ